MIPNDLVNYIERPALYFVKNVSDILADNTHQQELDPTDEKKCDHQRGVARRKSTVREEAIHQHQAVNHGKARHDRPHQHRDPQREAENETMPSEKNRSKYLREYFVSPAARCPQRNET